jgi:alpha-mannosidase
MLATPGAQELGEHSFEYALLLHRGDWRRGGVLHEARHFAAPSIAVKLGGAAVVPQKSLASVLPAAVIITALHPGQSGTIVRLLNSSPEPTDATLTPGFPAREAVEVDPLEQPAGRARVIFRDGVVHLRLDPWQLATIRLI